MTAAVLLTYAAATLVYSVALVVGDYIAGRRFDRLEPPKRARR